MAANLACLNCKWRGQTKGTLLKTPFPPSFCCLFWYRGKKVEQILAIKRKKNKIKQPQNKTKKNGFSNNTVLAYIFMIKGECAQGSHMHWDISCALLLHPVCEKQTPLYGCITPAHGVPLLNMIHKHFELSLIPLLRRILLLGSVIQMILFTQEWKSVA